MSVPIGFGDDYQPKPSFSDFQVKMRERDMEGYKEYGNRSYSKHPLRLLNEITEELVDVANWAAILYDRVQRLQRAFEAVEGCQNALKARQDLVGELAKHYHKLVRDIDGEEEEQQGD